MHKSIALSGQGEAWGRNRAFRPHRVTVWGIAAEAALELAIQGRRGTANAYFTMSPDEARQLARELVNAAGELDGHGWQCDVCGRWHEEMPADGCWDCGDADH